MYDVVIIGGGPAGMTAAIYASRAGLSLLVLEKGFSGGQMATTPEVENYPGIEKISGIELSMNMEQHAKKFNGDFKNESVTEIIPGTEFHTVITNVQQYQTKTIILALGAKRRKLEIAGEERLAGRGVSYCATCDGGFFRGRDVCVIGGGNTALEDALYLAGICNKVYLVHRRNQFRGYQSYVDAVEKNDKIEILYDAVPVHIEGENQVEAILVRDVKNDRMREIPVAGVFVAIGTIPDTELVKNKITLTPAGYVEAGEDTCTSIPGIYAAGDLRQKPIYQIITACADGAVAAHEAGIFIRERAAKV